MFNNRWKERTKRLEEENKEVMTLIREFLSLTDNWSEGYFDTIQHFAVLVKKLKREATEKEERAKIEAIILDLVKKSALKSE